MSKYIDADELLKAMDTWDKFGFSHSGAFVREPKNDDYVPYVHYDDMVKCVEGMPTADVIEVKRGKWISKETFFDNLNAFVCSNCKMRFASRNSRSWNFCSNCGSKMEVDE